MYIYDDGGLIKVMPVSMSSVVFNYVFNVLFFMYIYTYIHVCPYTGTCMKSSLYKSFYMYM